MVVVAIAMLFSLSIFFVFSPNIGGVAFSSPNPEVIVPVGTWHEAINRDDSWTGTGSTAVDPAEISTAAQFAQWSFLTQSNAASRSWHIRLTADIDLRAHEWIPIHLFDGTFDGGFFTITLPTTLRHLSHANAPVSGVFGRIQGTVSNVFTAGLINQFSPSTNSVYFGVLAGYAATNARVENVVNFANVNLNHSFDHADIAGIVGETINNALLINVGNFGNIHANIARSVSGILGLSSSGGSRVFNAFNAGNITANSLVGVSNGLGAIVGGSHAASVHINNVYNSGTATLGGQPRGIIGSTGGGATQTNVHNTTSPELMDILNDGIDGIPVAEQGNAKPWINLVGSDTPFFEFLMPFFGNVHIVQSSEIFDIDLPDRRSLHDAGERGAYYC